MADNINIDINVEWFIALSNKLDDCFERIKQLQTDMNTVEKDINTIKLLQAYQLDNLKNLNENIIYMKDNDTLTNNRLTTLEAKINDQSLNISYMDDKLSDLITTISEQFSQVQDTISNMFPKHNYSSEINKSNIFI